MTNVGPTGVYARAHRKAPTAAEALMWEHLRGGRKAGLPAWRREHPMGFCILDFYCPKGKLALEVDGGYHSTPEQQRLDGLRSARLLAERNIRVIRVSNEQVMADPVAVARWAWSQV